MVDVGIKGVLDSRPPRHAVIFTPAEVQQHNHPDDCWVSLHGRVLDVTPLISKFPGQLVEPLVKAAGADITHWFDEYGDPKRSVDPHTNIITPYCPQGLFLHVKPIAPRTDVAIDDQEVPWWRDGTLQVGWVSRRLIRVRVKNVLTSQEHEIEVPSEETLRQIRQRYLRFNWHAESYIWKALMIRDGVLDFYPLDMSLTLEENGVLNDRPEFERLDIDDDFYQPIIHLHWADDLSIA